MYSLIDLNVYETHLIAYHAYLKVKCLWQRLCEKLINNNLVVRLQIEQKLKSNTWKTIFERTLLKCLTCAFIYQTCLKALPK